MIPFRDTEQLSNLLTNAPNGSILVNTKLLSDRTYPTNILFGFDFDHTITTGPLSSWQMVRDPQSGILSSEGIERTIADYHTWRHAKGMQAQRLWGNSSTVIMREEGVTRTKLENLSRSINLRTGFYELASSIISSVGSLAVVTWGMDCMVEPCLKQTGLTVTNFNDVGGVPDGILSYAERVRFDKNGIIRPPPIRTRSDSVFGVPKIRFMSDYSNRNGGEKKGLVFIGDSEDADSPASGVDGRSILIVDKNTPNPSKLIKNTHFILKSDSLFPLIDLVNSFINPQENRI